MLKLGLSGALAALLLAAPAWAREEVPLPPANLPAAEWEHGVACSGYLLSIGLVMLEQRQANGSDTDEDALIDRIETSFGWWEDHLAARPDYDADRYKNDLTAFITGLAQSEHPDAAQWTANLDACVTEAEAGGAGG